MPRQPALSFEQQIIRLAVWIGGIAFALAGIFLVKVAADHGLLNAQFRVTIASIAGVALLLTGIWRRSREPNIAQSLSAAGIADLFACILAASKLYHWPFFTPTVTFLLLAITTALAVILSLRQGPFVALLGLVGGFLTPALIHTENPSAASLFGYLILLHVGLLTVTRNRGWSWLAALTVLCSFGWVCLYAIFQPFAPADAPVLGTFVLLATAFVAFTAGIQESAWKSNPLPARILTYGTLLAGFALSTFLLTRSNFSNTEWLFLGLLSAGLFLLARIRPLYEPFAWFAATFLMILLAAWGFFYPADVDRLRILLPTFGILSAFGAYACLWGSRQPVRWATLSVLCALVYTPIAYYLLDHAPRSDAWALLPTLAAFLYASLAYPIYQRRTSMPTGEQTLSTLALGALICLAFAPPMCLEGAQLTAAWSLLLPLALFLSMRFSLPALRSFAMTIAALVTLLLVPNPDLLNYATGPSLLWNPLLWGYVPSLTSFIAAIFLLERANLPTLSRVLQGATALIAIAFLTLLTHRFFHADALNTSFTALTERSTYPLVWLLLAAGFYHLGAHYKRPVLSYAGHLLTLLTLFFLVLVQVLAYNPLWNPEPLGATIFFNNLLYLYALPVLLITAHVLWARFRNDGPAQLPLAPFAASIALLLLFVFASLEIRHAFHGPVLAESLDHGFPATLLERSTYSALWLLLAFPLLALGKQFKNSLLTTAAYIFATIGLAYTFLIHALVCNPLWTPDDLGSPLIFNLLLYTYGLPALLTAALAVWLSNAKGAASITFSRIFGTASLALLFLLVTLQIRHAYQGPVIAQLLPLHSSLTERATYPAVWLALAFPLLAAARKFRSPLLEAAAHTFSTLALLFVFLVELFLLNPLWSHDNVGATLIVNRLLYVYALPAALSGALAYYLARDNSARAAAFARTAGISALFLLFTLVSLEVRQAFQGQFLDITLHPSFAENYAYSAAWACLGTALLVAAIFTRGTILRFASLTVMLATIIKVFLFDTAHLSDIYRVLSFAGLGLSLILLGLLYHYFVFRKPASTVPPRPTDCLAPPKSPVRDGAE